MAKRGDSPTADIKVRMREPLRAAIEAAASVNSVSMNAEAVDRLQRSFDEQALFASQDTRVWAILMAREFHKAGVAAAAHRDVDQADKVWMSDPDALLSASHSVMRALIRDLARLPKSDPEMILMVIDQLKAELANELVYAGRAKLVDKAGKSVMGFIERGDDNVNS